jgi:hypothetical protein
MSKPPRPLIAVSRQGRASTLPALRVLRNVIDDPELRGELEHRLANASPEERRLYQSELVDSSLALEHNANNSASIAGFVGQTTNVGGVVAGGAIVALTLGTVVATPVIVSCAAIAGLAYLGGQTAKLILDLRANEDKQRAKKYDDLRKQ